jgi:hypothetical protein
MATTAVPPLERRRSRNQRIPIKIAKTGNNVISEVNRQGTGQKEVLMGKVNCAGSHACNRGQRSADLLHLVGGSDRECSCRSGGAPIAFSGLTPGFHGLHQVNVIAPGGVTPGNTVPVAITAAGQSSALTLAVH